MQETNARNPVTVVLERMGINRLTLAMSANCGYTDIANAERGYPKSLPPSVKVALEMWGMPADESGPMYDEWRRTLELGPQRCRDDEPQ